jgi:spermidine/putrescine transport system substrate-binding protein
MIERPGAPAAAEDFLAYLCRPEAAVTAAFSGGTFNPVMQMGDPAVMRAYSPERLASIQWDTLEEDIARCAPYELAPDYQTLHAELVAARRAAGREA